MSGEQLDLLLDARLRLTDRSGRSSDYQIDCRGWILGSAPGCDLRLDQSAPPVWVLLVPCPGGILVRKLAPLVRVEVNGELWQSGIVSYPVQVRLGDLTLELTGLNDPALPEPLQSAAEDRPERWFRKARHLLRLMRGFVSGGGAVAPVPLSEEHTAPSMSPALETAWQMLRVAQEQHRDDLVRLERERALVASRWAEIERDRVERETARLQHHQRTEDLEARDHAVTVREAAVARSEQELFQSHLSQQQELLDLRQQRLDLESAQNDLEKKRLDLEARELELAARQAIIHVPAVVPPVEPVPVVEEAKLDPVVLSELVVEPATPLPHQPVVIEKPVAKAEVIPAIPEAWWPANENIPIAPEPVEIERPSPVNEAVESGPSEIISVMRSLLPESDKEIARQLPEWLQEWCRLGFSAAARARAGQSVGPALWEATGRIDDSDAALSRVLLNEGLAVSTDLERLLAAARLERRPLRSILLGDGVLTKYQLAQLETGNMAGLVIGPVAVLDRLPSGPREELFSVYDPRRGAEGMLHHLAESEMSDAARPDEYTQRALAVAAIESENLQATWEVFEIDGRPAVLREALVGCGSDSWSALAAVPGVWYRLVLQATLGLRDLHASGLTHGRVDASHVLLAPTGLVKLLDPAVPSWIFGSQMDDDPAADLKSLARLARTWLVDENRSGPKPKPLPPLLLTILDRLESLSGPAIATAVDLASELDHAGTQVPGNAAAWQRFLAEIRRDTGTELASFSA